MQQGAACELVLSSGFTMFSSRRLHEPQSLCATGGRALAAGLWQVQAYEFFAFMQAWFGAMAGAD